MTVTSGLPTFYPVWSPDGSVIVYKQRGEIPSLIEINKSWQSQSPKQLKASEEVDANFWPWSWASDGRRLAGWLRNLSTSENNIYVYTFENQSYEQLTSFGYKPVWLHDNRHLMFHAAGRIYVVDSLTKKTQEILSAPPYDAQTVCPTRDDRLLYYSVVRTEADIWVLNLEEPNK